MAGGLTKAKSRRHMKSKAKYQAQEKRKSWETQKAKVAKRQARREKKRHAKIEARKKRLGSKFIERGTARRLRREMEGVRDRWLKNSEVPAIA